VRGVRLNSRRGLELKASPLDFVLSFFFLRTELACQEFLELVAKNKKTEAMLFARSELGALLKSSADAIPAGGFFSWCFLFLFLRYFFKPERKHVRISA
jgi:hypothetical protein